VHAPVAGSTVAQIAVANVAGSSLAATTASVRANAFECTGVVERERAHS
jgi:hypothetical protein